MGSKYFIALSMFVLMTRLSAQPYPVDASVQVHPPFSPFLEDWAWGDSPSLQLVLRLLDQAEQQYPVRLRLSLTGEGISIKTKPNAALPLIYLDFGIPHILDGVDLAAYLDWNQLDIQGISPAVLWQNGGRLPEGIYNFCLEVLDGNRPLEAPISNQACRLLSVEALPPPVMLFPSMQATVENSPIQFQWVPQHLGSFPVAYTFRLFAERTGLSPAQIVGQTTPLFETELGAQLQFLYDGDEPPLENGKHYLSQVRVEDLNGNHHFQNEGYSEITSFQFGLDQAAECSLLSPNLRIHQIDSQGFSADWHTIHLAQTYELNISTDSSFQEQLSTYQTHSVTDTSFRFSGLSTQHPYFLRVRSTAGECFSEYSSVTKVRLPTHCTSTKDRELLDYACGQTPEAFEFKPEQTIPYLFVGDTIWANQFPIIVSAVRGSGPFSGEAYGEVAYLNSARVNYQMYGVQIDQSCQVVAGRLVVSGAGLALLSTSNLDLLTDILAGLETIEDWLAVSEEVLVEIDHILAKIESYLPESILRNLTDVRARAEAADAAYQAALASGDPDLISAAEQELEAATAALADALVAYQTALQQFLGTWLEVLGQLLLDLMQDCLWDQLRLAHELAQNTLEEFIQSEREEALLQVPASSTTWNLAEESEQVLVEKDSLSISLTFDQLSTDFYEKEMNYLRCITIEQLHHEIQNTASVQALQGLLQSIHGKSLDIIKEAIASGLSAPDIVPLVKNVMLEDLQTLIRRSHYPSMITRSNQ